MDRASVSGTEGRAFESRIARQERSRMYIYNKKGKSGKSNRSKTARLRAKIKRKNTRRKLRVSGRRW